jgi:dTDP-D-glucose 4,6-dehydratase
VGGIKRFIHVSTDEVSVRQVYVHVFKRFIHISTDEVWLWCTSFR